MRFYTNILTSALAAMVANAAVSREEAQYLAYLAKQGKSYTSRTEFTTRMRNWKNTDDFIRSHSATSFTLAHNQFSDSSAVERARLIGDRNFKASSPSSSKPTSHGGTSTLTTSSSFVQGARGSTDSKCKVCTRNLATCTKCNQNVMILSGG